ncbi:RNA ligase-domain-containing protein [Blyttiomyces helicus]|uniref:RNA ligase-domain-containing protein n=1 Tax=Blyttiomyces helicus TaxID=388810 RepID=A0A4P9VY18_9FUNG|nr:RNA ligase-domain-containing protein [Blyttiomyces helicus]|eukprot:RKO83835.1 RNA ligase-domain-containing protein [Blyttiomyces helicus]
MAEPSDAQPPFLAVQTFIRDHGWDALQGELRITVKKYDAHGLRKLNYSQVHSPKLHPVVLDCRGLLLDADANVVSRTFRRFFNHGELATHAQFDFANVTVFEKCDGSLLQLYYCPQTDRWEMGTRSSAFAEQAKSRGTYRDAILLAMQVGEDAFGRVAERHLDRRLTYALEYCGPSNKIGTEYDADHVVLLAVVSNVADHELPYEAVQAICDTLKADGINIRLPKVYNLTSLEGCRAALNDLLLPTEEGFVVRHNVTGERMKMKSVKYLAMNGLTNEPTFKRLVRLVHFNEQDEYLATYAKERPKIDKIVVARGALVQEIQGAYDQAVAGSPTKKQFALATQSLPYQKTLLHARKTGSTIEMAMSSMKAFQLVDLLATRMQVDPTAVEF